MVKSSTPTSAIMLHKAFYSFLKFHQLLFRYWLLWILWCLTGPRWYLPVGIPTS